MVRESEGIVARAVAEDGASSARRRFDRRRALVVALTLAVLIVLADQITKAAITARYAPCGNPTFYPVLGRYAGFSYVCNTGTAFSRFAGSQLVWIPVLIAVAAVIWLWLCSLAVPQLLQQLAFGLVIGGAVGNLIDRARLGGVTDFVDPVWWPAFNLADTAIVLGILGVLYLAEVGGAARRERAAG